MRPGDSNCTCTTNLRNWNCHDCAVAQLGRWEEIKSSQVQSNEISNHEDFEYDCLWNPKSLCMVCRRRPYNGLYRVRGEVVEQIKWCTICENLTRDNTRAMIIEYRWV